MEASNDIKLENVKTEFDENEDKYNDSERFTYLDGSIVKSEVFVEDIKVEEYFDEGEETKKSLTCTDTGIEENYFNEISQTNTSEILENFTDKVSSNLSHNNGNFIKTENQDADVPFDSMLENQIKSSINVQTIKDREKPTNRKRKNKLLPRQTIKDRGGSYKCEICDKVFCHRYSVTIHKRTHTGEKPYKCTLCSKQFNQSYGVHKHMVTHSKEKPYKCEECGENYKGKHNLNIHMRTHRKRYECEICMKYFGLHKTFIEHMRIHTGERPHECSVCNKTFNFKSVLYKHLLIHTGEKPHVCKLCGKGYRQSYDLVVHMRNHTGEKPYECHICNKKFTRNGDVGKHMRLHTSEKPYECHICNKKFNDHSNLKKHVQSHTGERPFGCKICQKTFTRNNYLTKHLQSHTEENPCK